MIDYKMLELKIASHVTQIVQDTRSALTVTAGGCWWSVVADADRQAIWSYC